MKLVEFKERNVVIAKDQREYFPLPAYRTDDGRIVCCWSLSIRERIKLLWSGRIWHSVLTFNNPLQPQLLEIQKPEMTEL